MGLLYTLHNIMYLAQCYSVSIKQFSFVAYQSHTETFGQIFERCVLPTIDFEVTKHWQAHGRFIEKIK